MRTSFLLLLAACSQTTPPPRAPSTQPATQPATASRDGRETHFEELRQLTFGGENAEAYWSHDGKQLILQATRPPYACDQIFTLTVDTPAPELRLVSTGKGRTTCSYFFPGNGNILYSSTHEAGPECPPVPDRSRGYVWPLYDSFDIYRAHADGSELSNVTRRPGYDAEATVCPKDGTVIFTSTRDGDLELYRMDPDGKNVVRLTHTPGYDGGAYFSPDCKKIVWRASRPKVGPELEDYQKLLAEGLVRPSKLEIFVANADGSEARQITYLDAASFAPSWFPSGERIIFSSNHGDPSGKGREFELWAVNVDGSGLERLTYTPGFDGFPMFSPDGTRLAFSSNRDGKEQGETNVFVARWRAEPVAVEPGPADRVLEDVAWLADDARTGRGLGTPGLEASAAWLEKRFADIGLEPAGDEGGFRHRLEVPTSVVAKEVVLEIDGAPVANVTPAGFSTSGAANAPIVYAGHGITAPEAGHDDYKKLNVKGKVVLVRRFAPEGRLAEPKFRRYTDVRYKAWNAREHGAVAVLIADLDEKDEVEPPRLAPSLMGDAGLPVLFVKRAVAQPLASSRRGRHAARVAVKLEVAREPTYNIVGRLRAGVDQAKRRAGVVVVGAHYDHLGMGGTSSLAPDVKAPHNGADDNASGVAALLESARILVPRRAELERDVVFVAFAAEELGVRGSTAFTAAPPGGLTIKEVVAMVNMDMVGRLRDNKLQVIGGDTAREWPGLIGEACTRARVECHTTDGGYGPSDQTPFYASGVPVLHLFTGAHREYHRPTDDTALINAAGGARVAVVAAELALSAGKQAERLTYHAAPAPPARGDMRASGASLGTVPDYVGPPPGQIGVLLAGVRPGSPADTAGLKRGDVLQKIDEHAIRSVEDFMYALSASTPGAKGKIVVLREGKKVELDVTFGGPMRR